jgi:enoyl-[acyl-carrier protein] reductase III
MDFTGKYALVTGSSRGIGRGIALALAARGARVAVHYYQNEAAARETLARVQQAGADGVIVQADVCRMDDIRRMVGRVGETFGALDFLVSNARTEVATFYEPPFDIPLEKWDTAVDSQAKAFLVMVREAQPILRDGSRIIAITYAPGGRFGSWQSWVAMGAAKSGLEVLSRYLAVALARRRITVNAISPGWIEDSVLNTLPPAVQQTIRTWHQSGWTPMGRLGTPADIGNAVALLCADEAGWITGQVIAVDGGSSLMDAALRLEILGVAAAQRV